MGTLVFLDVDGVLALDPAIVVGGREAVESMGYRPHQFDGAGPDGTRATGTVWLNPAHGVWLNGLRDRGAQLVWATSWGVGAADWIAPRLDLPAELRVVWRYPTVASRSAGRRSRARSAATPKSVGLTAWPVDASEVRAQTQTVLHPPAE